ncbi:invasion associated locus B family protein [Mesorhizobium sp. KR9-304]|uniref:invasion associated locus B family protein n=1 Tax=Mesorhizobium sp. KR9-304 TaxID=3156614 RepID=UPI0032B407A7
MSASLGVTKMSNWQRLHFETSVDWAVTGSGQMDEKHRVLLSLRKLTAGGRAVVGIVALATALGNSTAHAETTTKRPVETLMAQADAKEARPGTESTTKTVTTTTTHGGWTVTCSEGGTEPAKTCSANFRVINKKNNSVVLVWLIGRNKDGKLLAEFLTLTDIMIQPGVMVAIEEAKPVKAEYVSCATKGCKASLDLTPNLVRQMKEAKKAKIDMTLLDGQVVQFAMDIPGIDMALADLGL